MLPDQDWNSLSFGECDPQGDMRLVRALTIERHEAWLEDHRYLNMDLLKEHKKRAMRQAA